MSGLTRKFKLDEKSLGKLKTNFPDIDLEKATEIELDFSCISVTEHNEPYYELKNKGSIISNGDRTDLESYDKVLMGEAVDDLIYDALYEELIDSTDETDYEQLVIEMLNQSSPDELFLKLKYNEHDRVIPNKNKALYTVAKNGTVHDTNLIKVFLEESNDISYADLILQYPFNSSDIEFILKNDSLPKEILLDFMSKSEELPDIESILELTNVEEIESYYFKSWINRKTKDSASRNALRIFQKGLVTVPMINDYLNRFDLVFIADPILTLKNLPIDIAMKSAVVPQYQNLLLSNDRLKEIVIDEIFGHVQTNKVLNLIDKHANCPAEIRELILNKSVLISKEDITLAELARLMPLIFEEDFNLLDKKFSGEEYSVFKTNIRNLLESQSKDNVVDINRSKKEEANSEETVVLENVLPFKKSA